MKRSNILLIAFFSLVFVSILYLYITAKNNEKQNQVSAYAKVFNEISNMCIQFCEKTDEF